MAGEDQYIHPIIQAMAQFQQGLLAKQQLAQQLQNQQAEQEARNKQIDLAGKQLQEEHDFHLQQMQKANDAMQLQREIAMAQGKKNILDLIRSGVDPSALADQGQQGQPAQPNAPGVMGGLPATPDTRAISIPGGQSIPISQLPTPEQLVYQEANRAGTIAAAQQAPRTAAEKELQAQQQQFEAGQLSAKQDFEGRINTANLASRERIAKWDTGSQYAIAKMRTDAEYGSPEEQSTLLPAFVSGLSTGELQPNMTNPIDRRAAAAFINNGGRVVPKNDNQAMLQLGTLRDVYKKLDDLSAQLPSEKALGPNAATLNAAALAQIAHSPLPTDIQNKINELAPSIYSVVQNVQGFTGKRLNTQDMNLIQNGLLGVKTQEQMQDYKKSLQDTVNNRVANDLEAGMPQWQQNIVYQRTKVPPAWITQQINNDKLQDPQKAAGILVPDIDASVAKGQVVYKRNTNPIGSSQIPQTSTIPSPQQVPTSQFGGPQ